MNPPLTCAIVVTYHPDAAVLENLAALSLQTDHVVLVDNGSTPDELAPLRRITGDRIELIANPENLGIATALNQGIGRALALGASWIFLFDQDSRVTSAFIPDMIAAFATSPWGPRLATLVPRYIDSRTGRILPATPVREGIEAAMTSGSLYRAETFRTHGLFEDKLFIDGVDYEYSLRLRRHHLVLDECPAITLLHSPGDPHPHGIGGKTLFHTANYSPARRYYQERNKIWIARRYFVRFPIFCLKLCKFSAKDFVKIALAEPGKAKKLLWFLRGLFDGLREKMGPLR